MTYNILATGSGGNAVVVDEEEWLPVKGFEGLADIFGDLKVR